MNSMLAVLVLYPFAGGLLTWAVGGPNRNESIPFLKKYFTRSGLAASFFAVTEFLMMTAMFVTCFTRAALGEAITFTIPWICGFGLNFTLEGFRLIYGMVAAIMWMMATLMAQQYFKGHPNTARFYTFLLLTQGATMGVFLSSDFYTLFIFFEIMSFTSYEWVAQEENLPALRAADTYLGVAVIGGLVMLMGIFGLYHELGTLAFSELPAAAAAYTNKPVLFALGGCMLVGFGAKAGAFPLHIWLPKAHPVAPAPASALLSGILTKTGVFGVLLVTCDMFMQNWNWGVLLLVIGALTMFGGALLAVFSIDLKRTLACSSMSQIGFILIGAGMLCLLGEENMLAAHGTVLHMVNHSMIKLVLFMAAGVIYMNAHALDLNEIRGYGRKKPLLKAIFFVGAAAIAGIPMFSGYISKTLLHESILEYGGGLPFRALEYLFLFSGGMTVGYMTKLFVAIFVEKNKSEEKQAAFDAQKHYMNSVTTFALGGSALVLFIWGLFPHGIMDRAAALSQSFLKVSEFGEVIHYFSWSNLSGALISISIGVLVYLFIRMALMRNKEYINAWPAWLDLENLIYRPVLLHILPAIFGFFCGILDNLTDVVQRIATQVGSFFARILDTVLDLSVVGLRKTAYKDSPLPQEKTEGNWFTNIIGGVCNAFQSVANHTWRRKHPKNENYQHRMALWYDMLEENSMVIARSLSFGLLLVMIGLMLTLIYILWPR